MITARSCDPVQWDKVMRKAEILWDSKSSSSPCGRDGKIMGSMDPQNAGMGIFCTERKVPVPKPSLPSVAQPPLGTRWPGDPFRATPGTSRLLPLRSVPRAGGWEQLSES